MIINSVHLKNFRSHLNTKTNFGSGISTIIGENGAGKSSILEAISFALFKEYTSRKMENLINNKRDKMEVLVEFTAHGRRYKVIRKRRRNATSESSLYVKKNGGFSPIQRGDNAVTSEIEKIIELDKTIFLNAVYVRQGEIANLITKKPAEKKKLIGKLLGIDKLQSSWENTRYVIDEFEKRRSRIEGRLENFKEVKQKLEEKRKERDKIREKIKRNNLEIKMAEQELGKATIAKEDMDRKENEFDKIYREIEHEKDLLEREKETKMELEKNMEDIKAKEKEMELIEPEIDKIPILNELDRNMHELGKLKDKKRYIQDSVHKIEKSREFLEQNREIYNSFLEKKEEIMQLREKRKRYEGCDKLEDELSREMDKISSKVSKLKKEISKKLEEYGRILKVEVGSVAELDVHFQKALERLKKESDKNEVQINKLNSEISDLEGRNKEIQKLMDDLKKTEDRCPLCKSKITESHREKLLERCWKQITKNHHLISSFERELENLALEKDHLNSMDKRLKKINIDVLKRCFEDLEEKIKESNRITAELENVQFKVRKLREIDFELKKKINAKEGLKDVYEEYIGAERSLKTIGDYDKLIEELGEIKKKVKHLKLEISSLSAKVEVDPESADAVLKDLGELKEKFDRLRGEVRDKKEILEKLKKIKENIAERKRKLSDLETEIEKIGYDKEKHKIIMRDLKEKQNKHRKLQEEKGRLEGKLGEIYERIKELEEEIESYKRDKEELGKLSKFIGFLNEIRELYGKDGLQRILRDKSRPLIEKYTIDFFNMFNFEYSDIRLDEDYNITLYGPSGENTLDMISGGEKIAIALALRLGIAKALIKGNLELIMLDEPTVHLDFHRRQELTEVIKKLSVLPQMIIVTHDTALEQAADNILKIKKVGGESAVSASY